MVLPRLHCMNEPQFTQQFSKFMNICFFSNYPPLICPYTQYCTKHRFTHTEFCILVFSMPYFIVTLCHLLTQKYQLSSFLKIQLQSILEILRMSYRTSKEVTKKKCTGFEVIRFPSANGTKHNNLLSVKVQAALNLKETASTQVQQRTRH